MNVPVSVVDGEARARDGVRLSYTRYAANPGAPRIAFIHNLGLDRDLWTLVAEALAGRAEMVSYDCRGHGRSGRPAGPYRIAQFADDLADLLDHLNWPDTVVAGSSMGGCVAQDFATRYRYRTRGAVLADTTAWYGETAYEEWAERAAVAREEGLEAMVPWQFDRWFTEQFQQANPGLMNRLAKVFTSNDVDAYRACCAMLGELDLRGSAVAVAQPAVVLVGAENRSTPPEMAHELAARIGSGPALVIPGGRQLMPLENPQVLVEVISDLLRRTTLVASKP